MNKGDLPHHHHHPLKVVHALFPSVTPPRIKDYVAFPKPNGYRALHTTVEIDGRVIEVQIRTADMDRRAYLGEG